MGRREAGHRPAQAGEVILVVDADGLGYLVHAHAVALDLPQLLGVQRQHIPAFKPYAAADDPAQNVGDLFCRLFCAALFP